MQDPVFPSSHTIISPLLSFLPPLQRDRPTTRKTATRGAPKMVTRSAIWVRCGYHATGTRLPVAHGWCVTGPCAADNLVYALRVRFENSKNSKKIKIKNYKNYKNRNNVRKLLYFNFLRILSHEKYFQITPNFLTSRLVTHPRTTRGWACLTSPFHLHELSLTYLSFYWYYYHINPLKAYVCMYVYVYMCVCVCICICICIYMCVYVCIYICICVCICAYMCVYVCVYVCICVHVCIYVCI
jgi:hypothetical protein